MSKTVKKCIIGTKPPCHILSRLDERKARSKILRFVLKIRQKFYIKKIINLLDKKEEENQTNQMILLHMKIVTATKKPPNSKTKYSIHQIILLTI